MTVIADLEMFADPVRAKNSLWFFKTGKGEYGEGDRFIGATVPQMRTVAKKNREISFKEIETLIQSPIHEHRLTGYMILVYQYEKAGEAKRKEIYDFYISHAKNANNWDLVDSSAGHIVGGYLLDKPAKRTILPKLARSTNLWEKRIAIIATSAFIKNREFDDTLKIAEILLHDKHDLIHKAVGWMLREVGKKDQAAEEAFLHKHYKTMPRTMLRYAIEKFPEGKRKFYLAR